MSRLFCNTASKRQPYDTCTFDDLQVDFLALKRLVLRNVHMQIEKEEAVKFAEIAEITSEITRRDHQILLATLVNRLLLADLCLVQRREIDEGVLLEKIAQVLACCNAERMRGFENFLKQSLQDFIRSRKNVLLPTGKAIHKNIFYAFALCRFRLYFSAALENAQQLEKDKQLAQAEKHVSFKL